ncbi:hypothetical protein GO495_31075 [Chitinophaga oryziterrae]|uniref:HNH endonuclease n=1 Tax=Chitinophaga oryziterrae TaxID=1031224 RepID=A0A6N8JKX4_9BACT|nr:hypothetical protein [Chitinophaga oryziterrae]MVT45071.1 hypothetical protein [Chitinophaga oryziterrae]
MTLAPSKNDILAAEYNGEVAHITAASPAGPRYNIAMSAKERSGIDNSIFLCSNCATLIDKNNGMDYPVEKLKLWKTKHEAWVKKNLNKRADKVGEISNMNNNNRGIIAKNVYINSILPSSVDSVKFHDSGMFTAMEKICTEEKLMLILNLLKDRAECRIDDWDLFESLSSFFDKSSNSYINEDLETSKNFLHKSLQVLIGFMLGNFDMHPYDQSVDNYKTKLKPEYVYSSSLLDVTPEQRKKYQELSDSMLLLIDDLVMKYQIFRKTIKSVLHL